MSWLPLLVALPLLLVSPTTAAEEAALVGATAAKVQSVRGVPLSKRSVWIDGRRYDVWEYKSRTSSVEKTYFYFLNGRLESISKLKPR